jgi:hypothetical protein
MRASTLLFIFVAIFLAVSDGAYWYFSHDPTGTTTLALGAGMATIIATYLGFTTRRLPTLPEDRPDAEIAEGAGEVGFYSPHSWYPLPIAIGATVVALGFVFAYWLAVIGAAILIPSIAALLFEYYVTGQH